MHPALVFAGTYGPDIASWLLSRRVELGDAYARLTQPVMDAITDPTASIERIGSALVAQQNGQIEVLGILHQHTNKLDGITEAVNGVGNSIDGIGQSLGVLSSLSMIGLGFSVLSQVHIAFQFGALTRRMNTIDRRVQAIQDMLTQEQRARLAHGLDDLCRAGEVVATDAQASRQLAFDARMNLAGSRASYTEQLSDQLTRAGRGEPTYLWMLARHLTTAALGETACYLRLNQPDQAVGVINSGLSILKRHASAVFNRTISPNPTQFLMPAMVEHKITLEVLAELYRQAAHAGVLNDKQLSTTANLFESLRGRWGEASDPRFGKAKKVQRLRTEFAEAACAIEEVNRLQGLALEIAQCQRSGQSYLDLTGQILKDIEARRPTEGTCFAVFPPFIG